VGLGNDDSIVLLDTGDESNLPGGIMVTPVIYSNSQIQNDVPVHVVNSSNKTITIPAKSIVCHAVNVQLASPVTNEQSKHLDDFRELFPLDNLDDSQKQIVYDCLMRHTNAFSWDDWDLGHHEGYQHRIKLMDETPFKERYRRIPPAMVEEVRDHLHKMLDAGVITESTSPYSNL